jgi:hypothetical protein
LQTTESQESFALDDISGSDAPTHSDRGQDVGVNNPDAIRMRKGREADIKFYFDQSGLNAVCKECR